MATRYDKLTHSEDKLVFTKKLLRSSFQLVRKNCILWRKKVSFEYSEHIEQEKKLHIFYIAFDLFDDGIRQAEEKFYDELFNDIPTFSLGPDVLNKKLEKTGPTGIVPILREAMKKIYRVPEIREARERYLDNTIVEDKYIRRGEFGELLLYHLLHECFNADALISKIYFKDSANLPPHGFDAVHVDLENKIIWLGESKLYKDGKAAIDALSKDVDEHFNIDFFESEFQIITNRIEGDNYPKWIEELVDPNKQVLKKLAKINIALFAGFDSEMLNKMSENPTLSENDIEVDNLKNVLHTEIAQLNERLDRKIQKHCWKNKLNIYLFLFPMCDKNKFVADLHRKLKNGQKI